MPILNKENRLERKDERESKRIAKDQEREANVNQMISKEAERHGVNLNQPSSLSSDRKGEIDKKALEFAKGKQKDRLVSFQELTKAPTIEQPKEIDPEVLKDSYKRQKKARWWDAIYAMGQGMQGRTADPSVMRSKQEEEFRKGLYNQYKDVSKKGKEQSEAWESKYRNQTLEYLNEKIEDPNTPELQKTYLAQEKAKLEKLEAERDYKRKQTNLLGQKTPSKDKNDSPEYSYKTDDGQTLKMKVSTEDAILLNKTILDVNSLKSDRDRINKEMEAKLYAAESEGMGGTFGYGKSKEDIQAEIKAEYKEDLTKLNSQISAAEGHISSIFSKDTGSSTTEDTVDPWDL